MAYEGEERKNRKKKMKAKKDKWGQPVLAAAEEAEEPVETPRQKDGPRSGGEGYEPNKVVVSGMPYSTTEQQIRDLFKDIGPIQQLQLSQFPDSGNFRGLAFLTFQTEEIATNSLKLDGTKMGSRLVKVERCRLASPRKRKHEFVSEPGKVDGCLSAYIGNLSWNVTEDDIRDCFKTSNIASIRFSFDKRTGKFRGFCHIDFEDDESLEKAMKKNQVELCGRPIKISYSVGSIRGTCKVVHKRPFLSR